MHHDYAALYGDLTVIYQAYGAAAAQVTEFQVVASEFLQRLKSTGPGLPNTDLAKGVELLKKFQVCPLNTAQAQSQHAQPSCTSSTGNRLTAACQVNAGCFQSHSSSISCKACQS